MYQNSLFGGPSVNVAHGHMKTHEETDRHLTNLKSARLNYPNSTVQPFVLQSASVGFQYPKPALSYTVNNQVIERCQEVDHLGHPLHTGKTLEALAERRFSNLNAMFYSFISRFREFFPTTRNKLFHQYCSSMYGSQLWLMNSNNVE